MLFLLGITGYLNLGDIGTNGGFVVILYFCRQEICLGLGHRTVFDFNDDAVTTNLSYAGSGKHQ